MVIGVGLDIVEAARIERLLARYGQQFVRRLMRADEAAAVARRLGSSGRTFVRLELRGPLAVGEVWLLS